MQHEGPEFIPDPKAAVAPTLDRFDVEICTGQHPSEHVLVLNRETRTTFGIGQLHETLHHHVAVSAAIGHEVRPHGVDTQMKVRGVVLCPKAVVGHHLEGAVAPIERARKALDGLFVRKWRYNPVERSWPDELARGRPRSEGHGGEHRSAREGRGHCRSGKCRSRKRREETKGHLRSSSGTGSWQSPIQQFMNAAHQAFPPLSGYRSKHAEQPTRFRREGWLQSAGRPQCCCDLRHEPFSWLVYGKQLRSSLLRCRDRLETLRGHERRCDAPSGLCADPFKSAGGI